MRHEWVAAATGIYQSRNGLDLATVADGEALVIVTLIPDDPRWLTKEVSRWWAGTIARHRLTVANPLDDQDKGVLTRAACADPSAWDERTDGESSRHICMLPGVSAETNLAAHRASGATARGGSTST